MTRQGDGEFGDEREPSELWDAALTRLNFEGEREMERLNERTAAVTST